MPHHLLYLSQHLGFVVGNKTCAKLDCKQSKPVANPYEIKKKETTKVTINCWNKISRVPQTPFQLLKHGAGRLM